MSCSTAEVALVWSGLASLVLIRPEPRAIWDPGMDEAQWRRLSAAEFVPTGRTKGQWVPHQSVPDTWEIQYPLENGSSLHFSLEMTRFKHVGIFPEQGANWDWIARRMGSGKRMLNLFAYTGGASLAGRAAGAEVTHVDAIKQVVSWTRTNQELSGLDGIRWCVEDALKFSEREGRRGNQYDLVIMDPPSWGLGPKGEKWKLEEQVLRLVEATSKLVAPGGAVIMNTYSGVQSLGPRKTCGARCFQTAKWKPESCVCTVEQGKSCPPVLS